MHTWIIISYRWKLIVLLYHDENCLKSMSCPNVFPKSLRDVRVWKMLHLVLSFRGPEILSHSFFMQCGVWPYILSCKSNSISCQIISITWTVFMLLKWNNLHNHNHVFSWRRGLRHSSLLEFYSSILKQSEPSPLYYINQSLLNASPVQICGPFQSVLFLVPEGVLPLQDLTVNESRCLLSNGQYSLKWSGLIWCRSFPVKVSLMSVL